MILFLLLCLFPTQPTHEVRTVEGWQLHIDRRLLDDNAQQTEKAVELLKLQLQEIIRVVPAPAVEQMQKVPLWFSPPYKGTVEKAEYHPGEEWLKENGRNPELVKSVEFTNIAIFEKETRRMPNFALHELAHAYHDRVLSQGFGNPLVADCYQRAKAGGKYDRVERQDSEGNKTEDRAYALVNPQEYFAETTEAYFTRNDFFPYNREQLAVHDPSAVQMLGQAWGCEPPETPPAEKADTDEKDDKLPPVSYRLTIDAPQTHYVQIEARFKPASAGNLELFLPVWTPGSYLVREYARHIDSFEAMGKDNQPLSWSKINKNTWQVANVPAEGVTVRYRVYCNELSVRTNFVDAEFGILAGAATFLTSSQLASTAHQVQIQLPANWQQSVTPLEHPVSSPAHTYVANSYDELVDSPILLGNPKICPFRVGDVEHYLVNQGGEPFWNVDAAAADAAKVVAQHQAMWGTVPYKRYYFINLIAESGGGLEHDNSTVVITNRWSFSNDKNYKKWLGLISHEFFHAWNVRRLRPKALVQYDYQSEVYFDELWVAEGITSYYDELALVRAKLNTPKQYLAGLSKQIETLQSMPGRHKQSLVEASHDAWIKYYRPDENSTNTSINYYNKGAIAGFLLDLTIRKHTHNQKSLDDVMRTLYQRLAGEKGFTNQDVLQVASEISGTDLQPWFQRTVFSNQELEYAEALDWLGLEFKAAGDSKADPKAEGADAAKSIPWIGLTTETKEGRTTVSRVVEASPAFTAGLNVGDELIGLAGFRLSEPLDDRLKFYKVGDTVSATISRRGKLLELPVVIGSKPPAAWELQIVKDPKPEQKENLAKWLGQ